jgi:hypothetical protein
MLLRGLTASTGVMHEAQKLQLKNWGAVAFQGVGGWVSNIDITRKTVLYSITSTRKTAPKDLPKYVAALDRSIHWLLGGDWALNVKINGKSVYKGSREKANEQREQRSKNSRSNREAE